MARNLAAGLSPRNVRRQESAERRSSHDGPAGISLSLSGDDGEDLRRYWAELAAGGQVTVPLEKQV